MMTIIQPKNRVTAAIITSLIGSLSYVILSSEAKNSLDSFSFNQLAFIRSFVSLLLTIVGIAFVKKKHSFASFLKTKEIRTHAIRGLSGLATFYLILFSIRTISLTESNLLFNTCPLFVPFVAYCWKKKKIDPNVWPGILCAFVGIVLILHPTANHYNIGLWLGLLGGLLGAISVMALRFSYYTEPLTRSLFYYTLVSTIVTGGFCFIEGFPPGVLTNFSSFLSFLLVGCLGFSALLFTALSFKYAPAKFISPFAYASILFSLIFDYIFWDHKPNLLEISGMALVLLGFYLMILLLRPRKTTSQKIITLND